MDINPRYEYQPISQADEYVKSMNVLIDDYKLSLIEKHIDIANGTTTNKYVDIKDYMRLMRKYIDDCKAFHVDSCVDSVEINVTYVDKEKEMTNKFKAGDKVVALKGFHTIKVGDILTVDNITDYWFQAVECRGFTLNAANYELYKPEFKNMKGMFKNMKFRVNSPEQSKEIQEALFEMGYVWEAFGKTIQWTDQVCVTPWLHTDEDGILYRSWQDPDAEFSSISPFRHQECVVETTKSYKLIPVEIPKPETITIDGKTYDKEAVLKRLAELETVQN